MKILVHSYVPVCPYWDGAGLRVFNILPFLAARHECDLLEEHWPWQAEKTPLGGVTDTQAWIKSHVQRHWVVEHQPGEPVRFAWVHQSAQVASTLREAFTGGRYDVIWSGNDTLPIYSSELALADVPILINPTDSMNLAYRRALRMERSPRAWAATMARLLAYRRYEKRFLSAIPNWSMVSEADASDVRRRFPQCHVVVIPNGVAPEFFCPPHHQKRPDLVVFCGTLGVRSTNEMSLLWFLRRVWPSVKRGTPRASFRIIGRGPSAELQASVSSTAGVELVASVPDVRPHVWEAGVAVMPMRLGTGIKNKLLEAWAGRCAVVSTTLGVEGIPQAVNGENVLVEDEPLGMAGRLLDLLKAPTMQEALGDEGCATVRTHYTWEVVAASTEAYLRKVAGGHAESRAQGGPKR